MSIAAACLFISSISALKLSQQSAKQILSVKSIIGVLERTVQRDEGSRGLVDLIVDGDLFLSTLDLYRSNHVVVMTG
jgi:hypothetical protein